MIDIDDIELKCTDAINKEFDKFTESSLKIISTFCLETCFYRKLHTLFTESELLSITERVFTNSDIRDFVLDMTDKLSIKLKLGQAGSFELELYLAKSIAYYPSRASIVTTEILTPVRVLDNVCVYTDEILKSMTNDKWLVAIVLINMYFFNTNFFLNQEPSKYENGSAATSSQKQLTTTKSN